MSSYVDIVIVWSARDLGARVRDARSRMGWTQARLADEVGVSRQWIVALEGGKSSAEFGIVLRTLRSLGLVVDLVDVPVADLPVDLDRLLGEGP